MEQILIKKLYKTFDEKLWDKDNNAKYYNADADKQAAYDKAVRRRSKKRH